MKEPPSPLRPRPRLWSQVSDGLILKQLGELPRRHDAPENAHQQPREERRTGEYGPDDTFTVDGVLPRNDVEEGETTPLILEGPSSWLDEDTSPDVEIIEERVVTSQTTELPATSSPPTPAVRTVDISRLADRAAWIACGAALAALIGVFSAARGGAPTAAIGKASEPPPLPTSVVSRPPTHPPSAPLALLGGEPRSGLSAGSPTEWRTAPDGHAARRASRSERRPAIVSAKAPTRPERYDESGDEDAVMPLDVSGAPPGHARTGHTSVSRAPAPEVGPLPLPRSYRRIDVDDPFGQP